MAPRIKERNRIGTILLLSIPDDLDQWPLSIELWSSQHHCDGMMIHRLQLLLLLLLLLQ